MNTKDNSRSKESKIKLKEAILKILDSGKTIQEVTVLEVCKEANINRSTFYSHYRIPAEILEEIENDTILKLTDYVNSNSMIDKGKGSIINELHYIKENKTIFKVLFAHSKSHFFIKRFEQMTETILDDLNKSINDKAQIPFFQAYVLAGSRAIMNTWIENDFKESEEYISQLLYDFNMSVLEKISNRQWLRV